MIEALEDDLDVLKALWILDAMHESSRSPSEVAPADVANNLAASMVWLGIAQQEDFAEARADSEDLKETIRAAAAGVELAFIRTRIAARNEARKAKNFKESDRIRDELAAKGIVLKDGPSGTTWEVKR
jgi:cysteinyl-tRNA synthetase